MKKNPLTGILSGVLIWALLLGVYEVVAFVVHAIDAVAFAPFAPAFPLALFGIVGLLWGMGMLDGK